MRAAPPSPATPATVAALVSLDRIGLAPTSGPPHVLLLLPGMSTRRRPPGSVPHFLHLCVQVPPSQCGLPWPSDFPVKAPLSCKAPVPSGFDFVSRTYHHLTAWISFIGHVYCPMQCGHCECRVSTLLVAVHSEPTTVPSVEQVLKEYTKFRRVHALLSLCKCNPLLTTSIILSEHHKTAKHIPGLRSLLFPL